MWRHPCFVVLAALGSMCATSCTREDRPPEALPEPVTSSPKIQALIDRLKSPDESIREVALDQLQDIGEQTELPAADGIALLRATTEKFPPPGAEGLRDTPTWLVAAAASQPRPEYIPIVKELFPGWGREARERGLVLLSGIEETASAELFVTLLRQHAAEQTSPGPLVGLQSHPHHPEVFFPALLELTAHDNLAHDIHLTTLAFCHEGLLAPAALSSRSSALVTEYRKERDWLLARQRAGAGIGWMWEEDYQEHRERAAIYLDLFGCTPLAPVEPDLAQAMRFRDPKLVYFAITSLLRHGRTVPRDALEVVAGSSEMRVWLFEELTRIDRTDLFPARHLSQKALAESEMVRWLSDPAELGRPPDAIELVTTSSDDDGLDVYLFRFRTAPPHWAAHDGWMAGVAGPYRREESPTANALGGTFSKLERWDAKSPEEHVADLQQLLEETAVD